jgi:hypothetical protein
VRRVLFAALAVVLAGCGQPSPTDAVADLEALFPTLAQYRVTNLSRTDECEYIVYARGAFVTGGLSIMLTLRTWRPRGRRPP